MFHLFQIKPKQGKDLYFFVVLEVIAYPCIEIHAIVFLYHSTWRVGQRAQSQAHSWFKKEVEMLVQ